MKNKYKFRILILVISLVILNLGLNIVSENEIYVVTENNYISENEYKYVTAQPGDTIWSLVMDNIDYVDKSSYRDFNEVIYKTIEINGGSEIYIGQSIIIPKDI